MAHLLESYGLGSYNKNRTSRDRLINRALTQSILIYGYHGNPYFYMPAGTAEFWANVLKDEEGNFTSCTGFHTHSQGNCIWEMICSDTDLTPWPRAIMERILMMYPRKGNVLSRTAIPVNVINADVLPSFLEGDELKLQVVAPCIKVEYYGTEKELADAGVPNGYFWRILRNDGEMFPFQFYRNHKLGKGSPDYNESDLLISFRAKVKRTENGTVRIAGEEKASFIRCFADTQFGELEFIHAIDQVEEDQKKNIEDGAIICGACVLSADAAIYEYQDGIIKDFDHNRRLLRYVLQTGETERLRSVLAEDAVCYTNRYGGILRGTNSIIEGLKDIQRLPKGQYVAHLAKIVEVLSSEGEFPAGAECIFLTDTEELYEALVFLTTNDDGNIESITVSPGYGNRVSFETAPPLTSPMKFAEEAYKSYVEKKDSTC